MPPLEDFWHKYLRRFVLEHWYRFAKQRLHWTQPQLSSTQAAERWSERSAAVNLAIVALREKLASTPHCLLPKGEASAKAINSG